MKNDAMVCVEAGRRKLTANKKRLEVSSLSIDQFFFSEVCFLFTLFKESFLIIESLLSRESFFFSVRESILFSFFSAVESI